MEELSKLVDDLYEVFSTYRDPGKDFCQYCYSEPEVQHFKHTPLRQLGRMMHELYSGSRPIIGKVRMHTGITCREC